MSTIIIKDERRPSSSIARDLKLPKRFLKTSNTNTSSRLIALYTVKNVGRATTAEDFDMEECMILKSGKRKCICKIFIHIDVQKRGSKAKETKEVI